MRASVRNFTLVLTALALAGCTSLYTHPGPPRTVVREIGSPNIVRLTDKRGREVQLANAHIEGDSLVGVRSLASGERVAIAIADVVSVAVGEFDPVKTTLVFLGFALAALITLYTVFAVGYHGT